MTSLIPDARPKLLKLRPTQMTAGFAEVAEKRREWRAVPPPKRDKYLIDHAFPAVLGPGTRFFITDHHHLGLALIEDKVERCVVNQLADLSHLDLGEFWVVMDHKQWVHPYDAHGRRRAFDRLSGRLTGLKDDPYRSLAAEVRRKGGYAKEPAPFAEFQWADFFRRHIPHEIAPLSPAGIKRAMALCHEPAARHLPGWTAHSEEQSDKIAT